MATFHRSKSGVAWLRITWLELARYSDNMFPICDECLKDLIGFDNVVLIPILNQAYCPECGKAVLTGIHRYPEDKEIEIHREKFWLKYFGIEEG